MISYTLYLKEIDEGRSPNVPAPAIAIHYWKMAPDEAHHCDINHGYSSKIGGKTVDRSLAAPYPEHATEIRLND